MRYSKLFIATSFLVLSTLSIGDAHGIVFGKQQQEANINAAAQQSNSSTAKLAELTGLIAQNTKYQPDKTGWYADTIGFVRSYIDPATRMDVHFVVTWDGEVTERHHDRFGSCRSTISWGTIDSIQIPKR